MLASTLPAEPGDLESSGLFIAPLTWERRALPVVPSSRAHVSARGCHLRPACAGWLP